MADKTIQMMFAFSVYVEELRLKKLFVSQKNFQFIFIGN